ncbi:MAG: hypothetical protein KAH84_09120 [Thiomargarita sp.]|nr:hypothetical protein [Thiomargarita sp.]
MASNQSLSTRVDALEKTLKSLLETVDQLNNEIKTLKPVSEKKATKTANSAKKPTTKSDSPAKKASKKVPLTLLEAVNTLAIDDLIVKLKDAGAKQHIQRNIVNQRKRASFQEFSSLDDLIKRIKGLAKPTLDSILEQWS